METKPIATPTPNNHRKRNLRPLFFETKKGNLNKRKIVGRAIIVAIKTRISQSSRKILPNIMIKAPISTPL
ncbi:MAG: hypothetical protein ACXADY_11265 [Candidatus Hodarchaeales archaeon]